MFKAKDFIETSEGLVFAVVEEMTEQGRVLCFLRYVRHDSGWRKYPTQQANAFLKSAFPDYLYYSPEKDAHLHAVPEENIYMHHKPRERLQELLRLPHLESAENDCVQLCDLYQQNGLNLDCMGVTGSVLIGAQKQASDIDLVIYGRDHFQQARKLTRQLIEDGQLQPLTHSDWQESFQRRSCALSFDEYVWHEQRKFNKALINGRKFDLNLLNNEISQTRIHYEKQGRITLQAITIDAVGAYDYPARFGIDHPTVSSCVSYTATYTGQAKAGERVEISGFLERSSMGDLRVVVGSSREADDQYIKVIPDD